MLKIQEQFRKTYQEVGQINLVKWLNELSVCYYIGGHMFDSLSGQTEDLMIAFKSSFLTFSAERNRVKPLF